MFMRVSSQCLDVRSIAMTSWIGARRMLFEDARAGCGETLRGDVVRCSPTIETHA
jgi:hypothetical protein